MDASKPPDSTSAKNGDVFIMVESSHVDHLTTGASWLLRSVIFFREGVGGCVAESANDVRDCAVFCIHACISSL